MTLRPRQRAWVAMGVTLAAAVVAWAVTREDPVALASRFTPEHIDFLLMTDSGPQRRAHLVAFLMTALACVGVRWLRPRPHGAAAPPTRGRALAQWALGPILALALGVIVEAPGAAFVFSGLAVALLPVSASMRAGAVLGSLMASYAAFLLLPGIFATPDFATAPLLPLEFPEWHYAYVVSPGDRLAAGLELFNQVLPPYGVLVPTLLGAWERSQGLLSWGSHIQLVHVMNLAFVVVATAAAWLWFRGLPGVLVTVFFVLPWVASFHSSTLLPNQSGWRFLGLACAVLALVWLSRARRERWGYGLGLVTGALALFNPETALASAAGFFVFLVLRLGTLREVARACAQFAVVVPVPVVLWVFAYRGALGGWPFPSALGSVFDIGLRFSGGYGGFAFQKVGLAMAMLAHAVFCVVVAFARRRVDRRGAVRAAIGTTLIVWFAYYANRASAGNLWTYLFLYCFLLDGWLHPLSLRRAVQRLRRGQLAARSACFGLIFMVPVTEVNLSATARVLNRGFSAPPEEGIAEEVSGVWLPTEVARALVEQAAFVTATPDSLYLTAHAYSIPLLVGRFPDSPFGEPFAESMTPADTLRLEAWVRARRPARLLFDDPQGALAGAPAQRQYYARVRALLEDQYEPEGVVSGWLVLRRR